MLIKSIILMNILPFAFAACSSTSGPARLGKGLSVSPLQIEVSDDFEARTLNRVAFYPLENVPGGRIAPETLSKLSGVALNAFERETSLDFLNGSEPELFAAVYSKLARERGPLQSRAQSLGKAVKAQGVLYGFFSNYREREGTRLGASVSPSVSFTLLMIDVKTSSVVWTARYSREQKPLSENLFQVGSALKDGVGYKTSEQLSEIGFRDIARRLEKLRTSERQTSRNKLR